jgi:hypothetical protein
MDDEEERPPGLSDPLDAEYARWPGCRPTLSPAALPVAEHGSRAHAMTEV